MLLGVGEAQEAALAADLAKIRFCGNLIDDGGEREMLRVRIATELKEQGWFETGYGTICVNVFEIVKNKKNQIIEDICLK